MEKLLLILSLRDRDGWMRMMMANLVLLIKWWIFTSSGSGWRGRNLMMSRRLMRAGMRMRISRWIEGFSELVRKLLRVCGHKVNCMSYDWEGTTDFEDSDEVKKYLTDNMAEGYLADEEEAFIDELVSRYSELMRKEENFQRVIRTIQNNKVN